MDAALEVIGILIACAVPIATSALVGVWAGRASERFFASLTAASGGPIPRRTGLRFGLGMDDLAIDSFDYIPGMTAVFRPHADPAVERLRRHAAVGTALYYAQFLIGLVEAYVVAALLGVGPSIPLLVAFMAWGAFQYLAFRHHLWASRPEVRDYQSLAMHAYAIAGLVMVVTLAAAFGLVGVILLIHG